MAAVTQFQGWLTQFLIGFALSPPLLRDVFVKEYFSYNPNGAAYVQFLLALRGSKNKDAALT